MQEPCKLHAKQLKLVRSKKEVTIYLGGRGSGKSFVGAYLIASKLSRGENGLATAPTYPMLNAVLLREVLNMLRLYRVKYKYLKSDKEIHIFDKQGKQTAICYFRSTDNPDSLRGITNVSFLVMDEGCYSDKEAYDIAVACLRGKNIRNPQTYIISTPRGRASWVSQIWLDDGADYVERVQGTSLDNIENVGADYVEGLIRRYGEEFAKQEVFAEILDGSSHSVFTGDDIHALSVNRPVSDGKVTFALDVASTGSDYSVITVMVGGYVRDILKRKTTDDNVLLRFISEAISKHGKPDLMILDKTGLGNFLPSRFQQQWPDILFRGINFAEASKYEAYANKRAEMYFNLRNSIRKGLIAIDGIDKDILKDLEEELFAQEFTTNTQRKIILTKKEEVVKKIGRSCDISDSVALATMVIKGLSGEQIRQGLDEMKRKVKKR